MKRIANRLLLLGIALLLHTQVVKAEDWTIVPGIRLGPISRDTSEHDLVKLFGPQNVRPTTIHIGEGETQHATVIFPDDSSKTAVIVWRDSKTRKVPSGISIRTHHGANAVKTEKSIWKTEEGITIGTTLKTLEKLNGKPFTLLGFGWDNGGAVADCNGGRLAMLGGMTKNGPATNTLHLSLDPGHTSYETPAYMSVLGEQFFTSDHSAMQLLNPHVIAISFSFAPN